MIARIPAGLAGVLVCLLGVRGVPAATSYPGERPDTWDQPPSRLQEAGEPTLVPVGKGAIFVPSMTDPASEPAFSVLRDGEIIDTLATGTRAVLDPGIYEIRLGSGTLDDRFSRRVLVKEGRTTIVPATWSGLIVEVVDERSIPFRGSYEIIALPKRRNLGLGLGADIELGEEVRTWLLEPGTYMLIKTGESFQARRDFYTFRLQKGELLRLAVVMDREDGSLLGAGQTSLAEKRTEVSDWKLHLVIGGDAEANQRSHYQGLPDGYGFTLGGYFDFVAQYQPEFHLVYMRLKLEEKQIKLPGQPFQKDLDELKIDALYTYKVLPWLGPYVRVGTQTSVFPSYVDIGATRDVYLVDGSAQGRYLGAHNKMYQVAEPFAPIELKGGFGLSFIVSLSYIFDFNYGLWIFDIRDPARPVKVSGVATAGEADGLWTDGKHAYMWQTFGGTMFTMDVSNVRDPKRLGEYWDGGWVPRSYFRGKYTVASKGDAAYLPRYRGIVVIDVSDPARPKEAGLLRDENGGAVKSNAAACLHAHADRLYVFSRKNVLYIYDISAPLRPALVGHGSVPAQTFFIQSGKAYTASGTRKKPLSLFSIADISSDKPKQLSTLDLSGVAGALPIRGIVVRKGYAYLAACQRAPWTRLYVVDVSDPANPRLVRYCDPSPDLMDAPCSSSWGDSYRDMSIDGNYIFIGNYGQIECLDISDPERPKFFDRRDIGYQWSGGHKHGEYLYVPTLQGLVILAVPSSSQVPAGKVEVRANLRRR